MYLPKELKSLGRGKVGYVMYSLVMASLRPNSR